MHAHDAHDHDHAHAGHHAPASFGAAFAIGTGLNLAFVVAEAASGLAVHSMALLGDAVHNLGDVLGLAAAWAAAAMARRAPAGRYTYGYGRGTILAALFNAALLLVSVGAIGVEAIRRLIHPQPAAPGVIALVAAIGIVVNGGTALLFAAGRSADTNRRAAFAHMAADAATSAGVVLAAGLIALTGWSRIDPLVSLILAALIAWHTRDLAAESLTLSLDAVPAGIDAAAVRAFLSALPQVAALHDLHIWPISTTRAALTCHLVAPDAPPGFPAEVCAQLLARFGIDHSTIQIERAEDPCALAPDHVV